MLIFCLVIIRFFDKYYYVQFIDITASEEITKTIAFSSLSSIYYTLCNRLSNYKSCFFLILSTTLYF